MPVIGINQGSLPIIGFNYGAKQYDRAKKALIYGTIVGFTPINLNKINLFYSLNHSIIVFKFFN